MVFVPSSLFLFLLGAIVDEELEADEVEDEDGVGDREDGVDGGLGVWNSVVVVAESLEEVCELESLISDWNGVNVFVDLFIY